MTTREVSEEEIRTAVMIGTRAVHEGGPYQYVRVLADGRMVFLMNWGGGGLQLSVGRGDGFFTDSWVFDRTMTDAGWIAAIGWDGAGEPGGWYRHVQSGRRRPDGDPSKEFVRR